MRFSVLALDYDGTIASGGRAVPAVVRAIREARRRGIVVVLVTGRILSDLWRVLPERDLFDAIVAENGAVLAFPNGRTRQLGPAPSVALIDDLSRSGIKCSSGDCIVEAEATAAPIILESIRKLELPLMLVFNRSRVMILPQGVTKEKGLREVLNTMRLSLHNCIGIGDAENDFALLDACEIGVAVQWGSRALHDIADHILEGKGPEAVADYILQVSSYRKLPPNRADSRRILLGETTDELFDIAIHGRNILIAGDPRSGKSWITGMFCEHLILQGYSICVIDPEGDYVTLESLPGVVVFGGDEPPPRLSDVSRALRHPTTSVVIDLSAVTHDEKLSYVCELLPMLAELRGHSGLPHWIVVDEAHYFLSGADARAQVDLELAAYVLITYRPSLLYPELLEAVEAILTTPLSNPEEIRTLAALCNSEDQIDKWSILLGDLGIDEAARLPLDDERSGVPKRFTIARRITSHVRHRSKYLDVPMPEERAFRFTCEGRNIGEPARTLNEFVQSMCALPGEVIEGHAKRGDFSRWIAEVFGDHPLAEEIGSVETRFRKGGLPKVARSLSKAISSRYELQRIGNGFHSLKRES